MSEFRVVFICTGNIFRSAIAEAVFRAATEGLPVEVSSAGTLDLGGASAHTEAIQLAPRFGIDLSAHRSRCLTGVDLGEADLVVGFERAHVAAAVVESGADRARTFTLPELTGLLDTVPPTEGEPVEAARAAVERASAQRVESWSLPEIADPLGGSSAVFTESATLVAELTARLADQLFPQASAVAGREVPRSA